MGKPDLEDSALASSSEGPVLAYMPGGFVCRGRMDCLPACIDQRRFPSYRYVEPLAGTLLRECESRDREAAMLELRRKYSIPGPTPQPGETIESDELCQDN